MNNTASSHISEPTPELTQNTGQSVHVVVAQPTANTGMAITLEGIQELLKRELADSEDRVVSRISNSIGEEVEILKGQVIRTITNRTEDLEC